MHQRQPALYVMLVGFLCALFCGVGAISAEEGTRSAIRPDESGVKNLIGMLLLAIDDETVSSTAALVDADQTAREVERQAILTELAPSEKKAYFAELKWKMPARLLAQGKAGRWQRCRIQHMKYDGNGASVIVRMFGPESVGETAQSGKGQSSELMQFWLIQKDGDWWIYDWRDSHSVCRASTSTAIELFLGLSCESSEQIQVLLAAASAAGNRDYRVADTLLHKSEWVVYPPTLKAAWWLIAAQVAYGQSDPATTLKCLDKAAEQDCDLLPADIMRSAAHAALGNYAKSLVLAQQALDALGDDAAIHCRIGDALAGLERWDESAAAYRKGLQCDSDSVENLVGLGNVLPAGRRAEVGEQLAKCTGVSTQFPVLADSFLDAGNIEALEVLVETYEKIDPQQIITDYYRCKVLLLKKDYAAAARLLRSLLARVGKGDSPYLLLDEYLDTMLAAKKPLEAYQQAPDPQYCARYLARALFAAMDVDGLLALANAHAERAPNDKSVSLYVGNAYMVQKRYSDAESVFREGMQSASGTALSEAFRRRWVEAMFRLGKGLTAYDEVAPKTAVFDQLARLYAEAEQADELRKLIAKHRKTAPDSLSLLVWEAEASRIERDYATAAKLLKSVLPKVKDKELHSILARRVLDACLSANCPLDAYREMPDSESAFGYLADALIRAGDVKTLERLIELRRNDQPNDILLDFYGGHLHMLAKEYGQAEAVFAAGMAKTEDPEIRETFRSMRVEALLEMGEWLSTYQEVGPPNATYDQLSRYFAAAEKPDPLAALAAMHRKNNPGDPTIGLWEAEVQWLRGNFKEVVLVCQKHRKSILSDPDNRGRFEDRLVRSLVRLGRIEEAMQEAKASSRHDSDVWFEAVVHAVAGRTEETAEALAVCVGRGYEPADFYDDPDLGPALRSRNFADVRERFPDTRK